MEAVDFGMFACEIHDVPINHPFGDDAKREELRGDTQDGQDIWVRKTPPDHDFSEQALPQVISGPAHNMKIL